MSGIEEKVEFVGIPDLLIHIGEESKGELSLEKFFPALFGNTDAVYGEGSNKVLDPRQENFQRLMRFYFSDVWAFNLNDEKLLKKAMKVIERAKEWNQVKQEEDREEYQDRKRMFTSKVGDLLVIFPVRSKRALDFLSTTVVKIEHRGSTQTLRIPVVKCDEHHRVIDHYGVPRREMYLFDGYTGLEKDAEKALEIIYERTEDAIQKLVKEGKVNIIFVRKLSLSEGLCDDRFFSYLYEKFKGNEKVKGTLYYHARARSWHKAREITVYVKDKEVARITIKELDHTWDSQGKHYKKIGEVPAIILHDRFYRDTGDSVEKVAKEYAKLTSENTPVVAVVFVGPKNPPPLQSQLRNIEVIVQEELIEQKKAS